MFSNAPLQRQVKPEVVTVNTKAPEHAQSDIVPLTDMNSGQLVRRAKIIEAVIDLIGDVGADAVQMRDVAGRLLDRSDLKDIYRDAIKSYQGST